MKPGIIVVGSSNTDLSIRVAGLPQPGETVLGGEFLMAPGGKGANQAVAASRAGGRVSLIARLGQDSFGDRALASFVRDRIDVAHVSRDPRAASGTALIFVARDGENCIAVASGANHQLSPAHLKHAHPLFAQAKIVLMQLEIPLDTVRVAVRLAASHGVRVILNPAPARSIPSELLRSVSILTPNQAEAESLTGIHLSNLAAARKAAKRLRRRGVGTVILTLGARGALIADEKGERMIAGFRVKAVDTTAAGDVFNGALAVALGEGQLLDRAVHFANAAAALSVTRSGAQPSAPTRSSIERFLEAHGPAKAGAKSGKSLPAGGR